MGNFITKISAAFLDWTGAELEQIDRTRKSMTIHWALNPKSDIARIYTYLEKKEGED